MKILRNREDYGSLEQELCGLHLVEDTDSKIDTEFTQLQNVFSATFPNLDNGEDFEFTSWHNNIRMIWVYLYSDQFYNSELLARIKQMIDSMERPWFAQFECYSPALESKSNPNGVIGDFLLYRDSVVFSNSAGWDLIYPRIA